LTAVAATRVLPYRGPIVINPNRTQPDVDDGSLDPIMLPFLGAKEITGSWDGKLAYDDLPYTLAAAGKGGESPTGATAFVWTFDYASLTADSFEYLTDEWGDDTNASDGIQGIGGVIDSYSAGFGEDLSAFDLSAQLIYADAAMATARTGALTIDESPNWIYGGHVEYFLDTAAGSIGTTKWTDAIHGITWQWNNNLDQKRFANGSNTSFKLAGYGRGEREITVAVTTAKTAASMAEAATLDDVPVPERFIEMRVTSTEIITGSTPYSWSLTVPLYYTTREEVDSDGNTQIALTGRVVYDADLAYAIKSVTVNALATPSPL
jgi:hypothetical protein